MNFRHQSLRWVWSKECQGCRCPEFIALEPSKLKHLRSVLRLEWGSEIRALDGAGGIYRAILTQQGKCGGLQLLEKIDFQQAPLSNVELVIGFPKNKTMDDVIEKSTECGVRSILPVLTSRSVVAPRQGELQKYTDRWELIAADALEQSQQVWFPEISPPINWNEFLQRKYLGARFVFVSEARSAGSMGESGEILKKEIDKGVPIQIFIGPEGGFSMEERHQLEKLGFSELSLGNSILKVETAVIAALTLARR